METFWKIIGSGLCKEVRAPEYGRQHIGYSPGGPMDRFSMQIGNIMLGNADFARAVEIVFAPALEFQQDGLFVLTGARRQHASLQSGPDTVAVRHDTVEHAHKGDRLLLGETAYGLRTYLCFTPCNEGSPAPSILGRTRPAYKEINTFADPENRIRIIPGPEHSLLKSPQEFLDQPWSTTQEMSDMGIRLSCLGPNPPAVKHTTMVSEPVNDGTIQLTPKGPIILLRQRPTIGGYPRIFNVIAPDIDRLAQYGPNQVIRFREVSLEEALDITTSREQALNQFRLNWAGGK